jgi:predicted NAD/FAD-dependent oxidoreductase
MKVAIIGAGLSGLSAAWLLKEQISNVSIHVFEKSRALGGRLSTRRTPSGVAVDTGCQFLSIDDPELREFFFRLVPKDSYQELPLPILCLPDGFIVDPERRYFFPNGMTFWAKSVVEKLQKELGGRFVLNLENKIESLAVLSDYDAIFVSTPLPQARALGSVGDVEYHPCLTLVFHWDNPPEDATDYFAFRDISSREGVVWLSHEGMKRGHRGLWIAQVSARSSKSWFESAKSLDAFEDLLQNDIQAWVPRFSQGEKTVIDTKYWTYAFPVPLEDLPEDSPFERQTQGSQDVFYIGDGFRGVGRAENALESARAAVMSFAKSSSTTAVLGKKMNK